MNKEQAIEVAKKYFPFYPKVKTFYITNDEQAFENEVHAGNHARTLGKDNDVVHAINRDDVPDIAYNKKAKKN